MDFINIQCGIASRELMYGGLEVTADYFIWISGSTKQGNSNWMCSPKINNLYLVLQSVSHQTLNQTWGEQINKVMFEFQVLFMYIYTLLNKRIIEVDGNYQTITTKYSKDWDHKYYFEKQFPNPTATFLLIVTKSNISFQ